MPAYRVTVTTPGRLHFGMFSFGNPAIRQFGGVGLMIARPHTRIRATVATEFVACGPQSDRVECFVRQLVSGGLLAELPRCKIDVLAAPRGHSGLGSGTQLALATAASVDRLVGLTSGDPQQWAALLGRGARSAVGTYGFQTGGLIVEAGKYAGEEISPLITRVALPKTWRFLLMSSAEQGLADQGLSGQAERTAFERLPMVSPEATGQLCQEALLNLVPAARAGSFDTFSDSLYRFGHAAGNCFAGAQGGPFATPLLERRVKTLRAMGLHGVGQSSWGPTLFALLANQEGANMLIDQLRQHPDFEGVQFSVTSVDNHGVRIDVESETTLQARPPVKTSDELA